MPKRRRLIPGDMESVPVAAAPGPPSIDPMSNLLNFHYWSPDILPAQSPHPSPKNHKNQPNHESQESQKSLLKETRTFCRKGGRKVCRTLETIRPDVSFIRNQAFQVVKETEECQKGYRGCKHYHPANEQHPTRHLFYVISWQRWEDNDRCFLSQDVARWKKGGLET